MKYLVLFLRFCYIFLVHAYVMQSMMVTCSSTGVYFPLILQLRYQAHFISFICQELILQYGHIKVAIVF